MVIDILVLLLVVTAIFKGFKNGLIVAVFSFVALIVGAAAAIKLSGVAAMYLLQYWPNMATWVPFVSFIGVFLLAVLSVRLLAKFIHKAVDWSFLGWFNKAGGVAFYLLLYGVLTSVAMFYLLKSGFLNETIAQNSKTFPFLKDLAPTVMEWLGNLMPVFTNLFEQLEALFEKLGAKH